MQKAIIDGVDRSIASLVGQFQGEPTVAGFMKQAEMLAFIKGTNGKVLDSIRNGLQGLCGMRLTTA